MNTGERIVDYGIGPDELAVQAPELRTSPLPPEDGLEDLAVTRPAVAPQPDLSVYGVKGHYAEPTLSPASGRYATPYYSAYTNDGDFAGAVMAAPGQKIRLIDPSNGQVIFEGEGPEGAKMATQIANAVSQEKGRHAAWQIQGDYGQEGWKTQAAERYDPKKQGLLGKLADIALPILGAVLMPVTGGLSAALAAGLGAAGGSALSSIAQGRSLSDTLVRAALSGAGAGIGTGALGSLGGSGAGSTAAGAGGATGSGLGSSAATFTAAELAGAVAPLTVTAATGSGLGGALGAGLGSGLGGALQGNIGSDNLQGGAGNDTVSPEVSEVVVTAERAARQGMTLDQMLALGIPAAVATAAIASVAGGSNVPTVDEITVTGPAPATPSVTPAPPVVTTVPGLTTPPTGPETPSRVDQIKDWAVNHPELILAMLSAGAGATGGGGGKYAVPTGPGTPGTRESLGPIFGKSLPMSNLAVRQPRDMTGTDWKRYAMGPERSFFTNVPQGLARGGSPFAVGNGDGRSDDIEARLSDGEYVIDAETVALLGNGSSRAGAEKLDRFRVNVRKHKGRDLARGRFSVDAREPESYFAGGRS